MYPETDAVLHQSSRQDGSLQSRSKCSAFRARADYTSWPTALKPSDFDRNHVGVGFLPIGYRILLSASTGHISFF